MEKHIPPSKIVIGVTSGIAAYKVIDLVKSLRQKGHEVRVIMTEHATSMVDPAEFVKASRTQVYTELFPSDFSYEEVLKERQVDHIELADWADILVIAPATANTLAKLVYGIADDFLTTTVLATRASILVCPSMNTHMWENPIVQENLHKLVQRGFSIIPPDSGPLACGYDGVGRLADIAFIEHEVAHIIQVKNTLKGKKIIITAGGTSEPIDAVRMITNKASGKMGVALAEEAYQRGADVLLIHSKNSVSSYARIREELFETAEELETLIKKHASDYHAVFHTAAVSDFKPNNPVDEKLDSNTAFTIDLKPTSKILHKIKTWNPNITLVGFKAVYNKSEKELLKIAREKLEVSGSDYIIANDVGIEGIGFGVDENEVYIVSPIKRVKKIHRTSKTRIAREILDYIPL